MTKAKPALPAIDPAEAVDELGRLKFQIEALERREKELKASILAAGSDRVDGAVFTATVMTSSRWILDTAAARSALGEEWCDGHSKATLVRALKVTPRADVIEAVAAKLAA